MKTNTKINPQSGQVGFFIALLMSALLVVAGSVAINTTESTRRTASETQGTQLLHLGEGGLGFLQAGQANSVIEGLDLEELNRNFVARPDEGVIIDLNQGETLELNPSIHAPCRTQSCVVKIWWNNLGLDSADFCDGQAGLLVSEYSQDAADPLQMNACNNRDCEGPACDEFFAACQDPADNAGSIDPRTGLSRERARFYLFRPAICAFDNVPGRDWAGFETALGNPNLYANSRLPEARVTGPNSISERSNVLGIPGGEMVGNVQMTSKVFGEFSSNPILSSQFANYYEIPIFPNTTMVRIKPVFANTQVLIDMPGQVMQGISTASDGHQTRTVQITQTLPAVPGIMDYALFVGGGSIDKRTEATRDTVFP